MTTTLRLRHPHRGVLRGSRVRSRSWCGPPQCPNIGTGPRSSQRQRPSLGQFVPPPDPRFQSALPEPALAGSLQRGRRSLPSSPQGAVTVALVVCPGVLTATSGLRASRNSMPNCKVCRHPGHKHYELIDRGECAMCPCPQYVPNSYRSRHFLNNEPVRVNNWFLRPRRRN